MNRIERLILAGKVAPVLRDKVPRNIKTVDVAGRVVRTITDLELNDALLQREKIELAVTEDVARRFCKTCGIKLSDDLRYPSRDKRRGERKCSSRGKCRACTWVKRKERRCSNCAEKLSSGTQGNLCKRCRGIGAWEIRACAGCGAEIKTQRHNVIKRVARKPSPFRGKCRRCIQADSKNNERQQCKKCGKLLSRRARGQICNRCPRRVEIPSNVRLCPGNGFEACPAGKILPQSAFMQKATTRRNGRPARCVGCTLSHHQRTVVGIAEPKSYVRPGTELARERERMKTRKREELASSQRARVTCTCGQLKSATAARCKDCAKAPKRVCSSCGGRLGSSNRSGRCGKCWSVDDLRNVGRAHGHLGAPAVAR